MDYDPDGIVYADFFDGLTLDSVTFSYSCLIEQNMTSCGESKLLLSQGLIKGTYMVCLLYTSPSPRDATLSRMPSSA